jgi:tryptophan synthase beta chain
LDYPGVGPEHSYLKDSGRARYVHATDAEALAAAEVVAKTEGILTALETAHAFARLGTIAQELAALHKRPVSLVIASSGRGDKDLSTYLDRLETSS